MYNRTSWPGHETGHFTVNVADCPLPMWQRT